MFSKVARVVASKFLMISYEISSGPGDEPLHLFKAALSSLCEKGIGCNSLCCGLLGFVSRWIPRKPCMFGIRLGICCLRSFLCSVQLSSLLSRFAL